MFKNIYPIYAGSRRVYYIESSMRLNFHQAGLFCEYHGAHFAKVLSSQERSKAGSA